MCTSNIWCSQFLFILYCLSEFSLLFLCHTDDACRGWRRLGIKPKGVLMGIVQMCDRPSRKEPALRTFIGILMRLKLMGISLFPCHWQCVLGFLSLMASSTLLKLDVWFHRLHCEVNNDELCHVRVGNRSDQVGLRLVCLQSGPHRAFCVNNRVCLG